MRILRLSLEARINTRRRAFRMHAQAPEAFDFDRESPETKKFYGRDAEKTQDFGWQSLPAKRDAKKMIA